ncbi:serine/threonine protein kinase [Pelatocladus sp. BLCC-F211]|uniref:serine/threonine protein kinase n=1 Tax=Pelatocladus sp. BLCC-F211 TaxID=3342752 RepID=UPI0035B6D984
MPWAKGQQLQNGKYVIEEVLGQGGFGITYKALQIELNRHVVIKTPNEYLSYDPDYQKYIERFIEEGQILARLSQDPHPHIVGVIELFQEGNTHCLVMDFVPGENLFEAVRNRGALPEAEIVHCIRQIGEALCVLHQAGLVHRDAHPGNIMLRKNDKAVLIDFGIAKQIIPLTLSSTNRAGNDGFAPYEQRTRGSREPTVDIYCLAATLYYAVTGQRPTTSLARKLDNTLLTPPKEIISSISEQLNRAILKGMALEAEDRPQSMQSWLAMLEVPKQTSPPTVEPVHRKEVVRPPEAKSASKATPGQAATKSPRIIPWGWLVGVLLNYLFIGYSLAMSNGSLGAWAWAGAWAGAWAWAVALGGGVALAGAGNVAVALAGRVAGGVAVTVVWAVAVALAFGGVAGVVAAAGAMAWAVAWAVAAAAAWKKLLESFNKFHTFLILAGVSSLGLGLGWIGHWVFNTRS